MDIEGHEKTDGNPTRITLTSLLVKGLKNASLIGVAYFFGYMNWSFTWLVAPLILITIKEKRKEKFNIKRNIAQGAALTCEKDAILAHFDELPAWVYFPDVERAEWVNKIVKQIWPNVSLYARTLLGGPIEESLKSNLDRYKLKGFKFERIVLGSVPFRIGGVVVYDNVSRDEIVMDLDLSYAGDCDITFNLTGMKGGIKNLQMYGRLRIVMKPLIPTIPIVGGIQAFFLNSPDLDFDLVGIAQVLEIPGINDLLKKIVSDTISSMMVLPNKFPIQLSSNIDAAEIKSSHPRGVLRIHVIEAKELMKKDINFLGKGSSDPYAILRVGAQQFKTHTINSSIDPKWDEWSEFMVLEQGQQLYIHLWDKDATEDESLGMAFVDIENLINCVQSDMWINLEEAKHGKVHLRATWYNLSKDYTDLDAALIETRRLHVTTMHTAILTVFVDSAENLSQVKTGTNPDPFVFINLGKATHRTKTVQKAINPVWEEGYTFFVSNPQTDCLVLKCIDSKTDANLGDISYNLNNLAGKPELAVIREPFAFLKSGATSTIICSLFLRILKKEIEDDEVSVKSETRRESVRSKASAAAGADIPAAIKRSSNISMISNLSALDCDVFSDNYNPSIISNSGIIHRTSVTSSSGVAGLGRISLTLKYSYQRQRLIVIVHRLENIPIKDSSDLPDIYVKLYLLPDRSKESKRKTPIIKNALNPTFDEKIEYLVPEGDLESKTVNVIVVSEKIMKNYILGQVLINLAKYNLANSYSAWFDLMPAK